MAVGDVISDVSAVNGSLTIQPAAGVEVVITSYSDKAGSTNGRLTDGTLTTSDLPIPNGIKIPIDNSHYFFADAGGTGASTHYAGIQIG